MVVLRRLEVGRSVIHESPAGRDAVRPDETPCRQGGRDAVPDARLVADGGREQDPQRDACTLPLDPGVVRRQRTRGRMVEGAAQGHGDRAARRPGIRTGVQLQGCHMGERAKRRGLGRVGHVNDFTQF